MVFPGLGMVSHQITLIGPVFDHTGLKKKKYAQISPYQVVYF
jgi:hypothetical protein